MATSGVVISDNMHPIKWCRRSPRSGSASAPYTEAFRTLLVVF